MVDGDNPLISILTETSPDPVITCVDDVLDRDPLVVPYLNHIVVDCPLAFTVPFNVTEFVVTFVADPVVTTGAVTPYVVKDISLPSVVPALFCANTL